MALVTSTMNKYKSVHLLLFNAKLKFTLVRISRQGLHHSSVKMQDTRTPVHSQLRLDQLKLMNYTMTVDEEKVEANVKTAGVNYSDFDAKNSQPKPYQLMKLAESARFFSHHWPLDESGRSFRDYAQLTSDRLTFLVTSKMDITTALYDVKVPKNPLDIKVQGGYVGNTSVTSIATAFTEGGVEIFHNTNQVVFVSKDTRRPIKLPDWWKDKFAKLGENFEPLKLEKCAKPDNIDPYRIHVVRSDLDGNGHTNWSCYVRFSVDAIYNFVKNGKLTDLGDVDNRFLKSFEVMYAGESFDEDVLDVYVWPENVNVAMVHIYKDENFIFQGKFEYFPIDTKV